MTLHEFESIITKIRPQMLAKATAIIMSEEDAEDVVQEVSMKLWLLREHWEDYENFFGLAMTACRHQALNMKRDKGLEISLTEDAAYTDAADEEMIMSEQTARLESLIEDLPDTQQMMLRMRHSDELEYEDIALVMGTTAAHVRTSLSRTRRKLFDEYNKEY